MSSKTIIPSDLTGNIPKSDSAIPNQHEIENPAINVSTQISLTGTSVNAHIAAEIDPEKRNEDVLHPNEDTINVETKIKNEKSKSKTSINDSESSKELKDNNAEIVHVETNDNAKTNDKNSTLVSTEGNQKIEFTNQRIAKQFRVSSTNKIHTNTGGKVNKIFFGTVEKIIPGKGKMWRIMYDDGDVDIMSRTNILNAIRYYDKNRKYDTNHAHKILISPLLNSEEKDMSTTKASPPKKGKKIKAKVTRKEPLPVWTGTPDEDIDGGWPKGWVKKVYARKNGATKGATDRYWYSPKEKFKLRSMVQVRKFLKALAGTKGDEIMAKKTMVNY